MTGKSLVPGFMVHGSRLNLHTNRNSETLPSCTTIIVCSVFQFVPGLPKGRKKNYSRLVVRQACCFPVLPSKSLRYVSSSAVRAVNTLTFFFRMVQLNARFSKAGAKLLLFFDMTKYFHKKISKKCIFGRFWPKIGVKMMNYWNE